MSETIDLPLQIGVKMKGWYRCVLNEGTEREVDTGWFPNLITNGGLDRLGTTVGDNIFVWSSIGTGTTAPANTDTSLVSYTASVSSRTNDTQVNAGSPNYEYTLQFHHTYAQGAVTGNMAEVGVGWASGGGSLWSRALILDGGGSPTTLTVTSLDQLSVYYKIITYPTITDITGSVSISATSYSYTGRIANAASFSAGVNTLGGEGSSTLFGRITQGTAYSTSTLGAITSAPSGTQSPGTSNNSTTASYTTGNKYLDSTYTFSPSEGNSSGGIGSLVLFYRFGNFQYSFSASIPKDNTKTFTITTRVSWDRI